MIRIKKMRFENIKKIKRRESKILKRMKIKCAYGRENKTRKIKS